MKAVRDSSSEPVGPVGLDANAARRLLPHRCDVPLLPTEGPKHWICPTCESIWRWNYLSEEWEEEL